MKFQKSAMRRAVVAFAKAKGKRWSYQLIADHFGVTRNVVAGILFRERHPHSERIRSPGSRWGNMIGISYRPRSYYPEKTAQNTR